MPVTYLINSSFFIRGLSIPNTEKIADKIQFFIAKYEPECLVKILGYPLFKLLGSESSARMTSLLSGSEYVDSYGILAKWEGLVHNTDQSLIANYVYFFFQEATTTNTTGTGVAITKKESGYAASPIDKQVNAWNSFSEEVSNMCEFLLWKKTAGVRDYPEFTTYQYYKTKRISRKINAFGI
jgi:hypothetical protein